MSLEEEDVLRGGWDEAEVLFQACSLQMPIRHPSEDARSLWSCEERTRLKSQFWNCQYSKSFPWVRSPSSSCRWWEEVQILRLGYSDV